MEREVGVVRELGSGVRRAEGREWACGGKC